MISTGHTVAAAMIKAQNYDAVKDFAPVGIIASSAIAIVGLAFIAGAATLFFVGDFLIDLIFN